MSIEFRCPTCGKLLRTANETAGKRAKCPDCSTVVTIPAPGQASTPPVPPVQPPTGGGSVPPTPPSRQPSPNPFQSPEASLDAPPGSAAALTPGRVDFGDLLGTSWAILKANLGMAALLTLICLVIMVAVSAVLTVASLGVAVSTQSQTLGHVLGVVNHLATTLVGACLFAGMLKATLKFARGQPASPADLFAFGPELGPFLLTYLIFAVIVVVGTLLCVIPGVILTYMFYPCLVLVVDRKMAVVDSFNEAKRLTHGNKITLFFAMFVAGLLAELGTVLTCFVGILAAAPYMTLIYVVAYLRMSGQPIAVAR